MADVLAIREAHASLELDLVDPIEPVEAFFEIPECEVGLVETAEQEDPGVGGRKGLLVLHRSTPGRAVAAQLLAVLNDGFAGRILEQRVGIALATLARDLAGGVVVGETRGLVAGELVGVRRVELRPVEQRREQLRRQAPGLVRLRCDGFVFQPSLVAVVVVLLDSRWQGRGDGLDHVLLVAHRLLRERLPCRAEYGEDQRAKKQGSSGQHVPCVRPTGQVVQLITRGPAAPRAALTRSGLRLNWPHVVE